MNELSNVASATGTYDSVPISLTSNTNVVKILDGLTLTLSADKTYWKDGNLLYTIIINNETDIKYETVTISDVLNKSYISFIDGTVQINGAYATSGEYNYNEGTSTLTINLASVEAQTKTTITFNVKKN